jgi:hypothetical protein
MNGHGAREHDALGRAMRDLRASGDTLLSTLHQNVSPPSNVNRAGHSGKTIYTSASTLSRLWQLASGQGAHGAVGTLVEDHKIRGTSVKRGWRLASALRLGLLLIGLAASCSRQPSAITDQCTGDSFQIDLADLPDAELGEDPEERVEQLRDWIWPVLLARLEATAGLEGLLIGSATQPLLRDDALAHVLDHPVGSARSGVAEDGTVVVMVQAEELTSMQEVLLEALDQEALHLGAIPEETLVYRYSIDERSGYADVCQLGAVDEDWIESQRQGFRRATVRKTRELASFLDGGVDLLTAQCTDEGLAVTGRVRSRVRKAPMTLEHVASLYKAPEIQYVPVAQLGASLGELSVEQRSWLTEVASVVETATDRELEQVRAELDRDTWNMLVRVRAWQALHPGVATQDFLVSWLAQHQAGQDLGFSLDPRLRAGDAVRHIDEFIAALEEPSKLAALLYSWDVDPARAMALVELIGADGARELFTQSLSKLRNELRTSSDHEAFGILKKVRLAPESFEQMLTALAVGVLDDHSAYQCARYDGPLQGTAVGMTMFYTDLLMKLWSGDRQGSAPDGLIPGFVSVVAHDVSSAYCTEEEAKYPNTRAWLGLREEQYAREGEERVRFAPVTTRVFARGSELGADHSEEVEANAQMRRFYRWWNAHYARVADWEPQYELLNQIMKWSVAVQSAKLSEQGCMAFLDEVPVERSQRFGQWVAKHDELRWRGPVPLLNRDDEATECLPVLRSRGYPACGGTGYLSGGVSAATRATLEGKPLMRAGRARQLGRLDAMSPAQPTVMSNGRVTYQSVARPDGKLRHVEIDPGQRTLSARIETEQSQRGTRHSYVADGPVVGVKKSWRLDKGKLSGQDALDAQHGTFGVAHLQADDVTSRVVRPRVTHEATAQVRSIGEEAARRLTDSEKSLSQVAPDLPGVTNAWQIDNDRVLVEIAHAGGGSPRYGLMSSSGGIRGPPPPLPPGSLIGRFGSDGAHGGGRSAVEVALLSDDAARQIRATASAQLPPSPSAKVRILFAKALDEAEDEFGSLERTIKELLEQGADPASIRVALAHAYREAARQGKNTDRLAALHLRVSITHGKPRSVVPESNAFPADGTDFIVPSSHAKMYAETAALPPGQNPALQAGTAPPEFHARLIEESFTLPDAPGAIQLGDAEYTVIRRTGQAATTGRRVVYVIHPCRQDGQEESSATVECQGRTAARRAEEEGRRTLLAAACRLGPETAQGLGVTDCK